MKLLPLAVPLLILACAGCHRPASDSIGVVRSVEFLSPEDMGATKYLFEAQAGKDQVVVLRSEKYVNGKLTDSIDAISNERDEKVSFPVVVYDRSFFNQFTGSLQPGYIFQLPTDRWEVNARIRSKGGDPGSINFVFQDVVYGKPDKMKVVSEIKVVLSIFTESYEKAKRDVPNLSPDEPNRSWVYSAPKITNGQPVPTARQ